MGKETFINIDHQPLQYLHSQSKLHQSRHYKWMGFLQQFHLFIIYKKGINNKVVDMLSRPPISAYIVLKNASLAHVNYSEQYTIDEYFKDVYERCYHTSCRLGKSRPNHQVVTTKGHYTNVTSIYISLFKGD
jgi:hypothetical protein